MKIIKYNISDNSYFNLPNIRVTYIYSHMCLIMCQNNRNNSTSRARQQFAKIYHFIMIITNL